VSAARYTAMTPCVLMLVNAPDRVADVVTGPSTPLPYRWHTASRPPSRPAPLASVPLPKSTYSSRTNPLVKAVIVGHGWLSATAL
jgi:hypothetical protein